MPAYPMNGKYDVKETKCLKCKRVISDEESRARYEYLARTYGIVPKLVPICKDCRGENV